MRRIAQLVLVVGLALAPTAAAFADQYDCSASYLPCDGTNLDYHDSLGDTPMPYDWGWSGWYGEYDTSYLGDAGSGPYWGSLGDPAYGGGLGD